MSREQLLARLKAAAFAIVAELGANAALEALDRVKTEIGNDQWGRR